MKLRKLLFICLFFCLEFISYASGGSTMRRTGRARFIPRFNSTNINKVEFKLKYNFFIPGNTRRISMIVNLPKTLANRQKVLSTQFSTRPVRIFNNKENRYAEFVFDYPDRRVEIEINIKIELYKYDLYTAQARRIKDRTKGPDFSDFLKQEKYIEKDNPEIQKVAEGIGGRTDLEIVRNIYDYVIDNMEYTLNGRRASGAAGALRLGKGDCTEYSDLFVALCRAAGIPARFCTGYTVQPDVSQSRHNWVEVYFQDYGWVPLDPSRGDINSSFFRERTFSTLSPVYIFLSHIRNDTILRNSQFARYTYRGDRVRLTESIEFTSFN